MKTTVQKDRSALHAASPLFAKKGEGSFFTPTHEAEQPFFVPHISRQVNSDYHSSPRKPFFSPKPVIQPKLTINEPGDAYEQEADAMAERVMRMETGAGDHASEGKKLLADGGSVQNKRISHLPIIQRVAYPDYLSESKEPSILSQVPKASNEVPLLFEFDVKWIRSALAEGRRDLALNWLLLGLDPGNYYRKLLHQEKLHILNGPGNSTTSQGPAFKEWLAGELSNMPKKDRRKVDKVRAFLNTLNVPLDKLDIKVEIAESAFDNIHDLYNTIRHEWVHVEQIVRNPTLYIARSVFPADNFTNPSTDKQLELYELEAYIWEAENMEKTGINKFPSEVYRTWLELENSGRRIGYKVGKVFDKQYKEAYKLTWETAFEGFLKEAEYQLTDVDIVKSAYKSLNRLWKLDVPKGIAIDKQKFEIRFRTLQNNWFLFYLNDIQGIIKEGVDKFQKNGHYSWFELLTNWKELDSNNKTLLQEGYTEIMGKLFEEVFSAHESEAKALTPDGPKDRNYDLHFENHVYNMTVMIEESKFCFVDVKSFEKRLKDLKKIKKTQMTIQPKLTINEPGDAYEQEADAMAERVMRMESTAGNPMDEEDGSLQRMPLLRKSEGGGYLASSQLTSQLSNSKGSGNPLPKPTLGFMNQAFGSDFSNVRIHTGTQAVEMSQDIQAKAFTHGSDIYFNQGQYSPETSEGKKLLAHELTHVGQQQVSSKLMRFIFGGCGGSSAPPSPPSTLYLRERQVGNVQGCGELSDWIIQWELDRPSVQGGHIIQKIVRISKIENCTGDDITLTKTAKRSWEAWEAWPVNSGQKVTITAQNGDPDDDFFSHPDRGNSTKGIVFMSGIAHFYEGLNSLPSHFQKQHPNTLANDLPSTTQDPQLSGGTLAAGRLIIYEWDCCHTPSKRKIRERYTF